MGQAQEAVQEDVVVQSSSDSRTRAQAAAGTMEEVIVRGQRSLSAMIREGAQLTEDFYDRLNLVIENPDFHVDCDTEYPTGSNIPTRVCRTGFQERL
ncbi:MAG: hypothetical protein PVH89_04530 [Gammaproteobacteria bacterium]